MPTCCGNWVGKNLQIKTKMKKLLIILLALPCLAFAQKTPKGVVYDAQILRVSDGDTVVIAAPFYLHPLSQNLRYVSTESTHPKKDFVDSATVKKPEVKPLAFSLKISFKPVNSDKWSFMDGISSVGVSWAISY
jgi:hypothetical protein